MKALYYPTKTDPSPSTWTPTTGPSSESRPLLIGVFQQRTASQFKRDIGTHAPLRGWRFDFDWLTEEDYEARKAFALASRLNSFEMELADGEIVTVKFVGASLEWTPEKPEGRAGFMRWVEEFEEQSAMPLPLDAATFVRGFIDIEDTASTGSVVFDSAFPDAGYAAFIEETTPSDGVDTFIEAKIVHDSLTEEGFDVILSMAPGAGNSVRVYYLAVR